MNNNKPKEKHCFYSTHDIEVDYKDVQNLQRFTSSYHKIVPQRRSALSSKYQRRIAQAIKRARFMALVPYVRR